MNALQNALTISDFQGDTLSATNNLSYYDGLLKIVDAGAAVDGNTGAVTVATGISSSNCTRHLRWFMWESLSLTISQKQMTLSLLGTYISLQEICSSIEKR